MFVCAFDLSLFLSHAHTKSRALSLAQPVRIILARPLIVSVSSSLFLALSFFRSFFLALFSSFSSYRSIFHPPLSVPLVGSFVHSPSLSLSLYFPLFSSLLCTHPLSLSLSLVRSHFLTLSPSLASCSLLSHLLPLSHSLSHSLSLPRSFSRIIFLSRPSPFPFLPLAYCLSLPLAPPSCLSIYHSACPSRSPVLSLSLALFLTLSLSFFLCHS